MNTALSYAENHSDQFVDELEELLRIPSVKIGRASCRERV